MMKEFLFLVMLGSIALLAACSPAIQLEPEHPLYETTVPPAISTLVPPGGTVDLNELTPLPTDSTGKPHEAPKPGIPDPAKYMTSLASQDLALRLGIDIGAIEVLDVQEVDWPDSSLGCPQAGISYAEVITPGFRIVLVHNGQKYLYHTDRQEQVVYCMNEKPSP